MSATGDDKSAVAGVHLAAGRIVGAARAITEAYRFGVPEGPHPEPWTAAYHSGAVRVYAESLPMSYQRRIGSLFVHSAEAMDAVDLPADLVEDWFVVRSYMRSASTAIADWLAAEGAARGRRRGSRRRRSTTRARPG
ncbi:MAG: hypothetical protein OXC00_02840 [Acidimicrobiaceae bacterium]|nr:hypothetical protein [Acidimicrobiaceae bacterium]